MTFSGRVSVITGAASGIGRGLALELADRGSDLALCDVNEAGLTETARMAEALGRTVTRKVVDVADRKAVYTFADEVLTEHGRVDAIVNNAGVSVTDTVAEMSYDDLEWIVDINFWGVVYGTKAFLPALLERGDGWIVNVSSVFGLVAFPSQSAYNATKFAVRGFTESLRQELEGTGVTASCVHPGGIKTNIVRSSRFRRAHDGPVPREEFVADFDRMARTSPEEAGRVIADGMERRAPRILIGNDARMIEAIARMAPVSYPGLFKRLADRLRKK
ncbi:MAG TPA: SDR family oxidoreductase [Sandaracinaceae bacterium LLY-WYZ-13_1]|nr:SDR family oxidoreductase [Sandaracinaceae bacterium LLY-WYZ-13_1]